MKTNLVRARGRLALAVLCGLAALAPTVAAATEPAASDAQALRYQAERTRCLNGKSGQALETCLKEAGAAKMTHDGQLTAADRAAESKRCEPLAGDDKRDCIARASGTSGTTTTSGSVKEGGIVRETKTTIPAPAASAGR